MWMQGCTLWQNPGAHTKELLPGVFGNGLFRDGLISPFHQRLARYRPSGPG